ncbi:MAG: MFS transporter [Coxiellaceae bacterium]|jgi:MFS family permease|nr:MFS transporter [Coxiellaceae bacterium]
MKQSKITFLSSIGAGLEYYDFVIYVIFASFISQNFFPDSNRVVALFATFGVFAIGNIIRPLGGIVLGICGDKFGRKKVFTHTLLWMAFATFLMGITPTFATLGLTATIIFSICRILQGVTCGAEIPGATTFLLEHIHAKRHGLHFGFMSSSVGLGSSLGLLVAWIITKLLTDEQMFRWGFRLPFLFGGVLALVGFLIRKHVPETPAFLALQKANNKFLAGINKYHCKQVLNTIGVLIFPASFVTFFLAFPAYLHDYYHYTFPNIYLAMTIGSLWTAFLIPVFGWISDYIPNRKILLLIAALIFVLFSFPAFSLLHSQTNWALFGFIIFGKTLLAAMAASYFVLLPKAFPTMSRYTGTAFSYNIVYSIAALIPLAMNYAYGVLKNQDYLIWTLLLLAGLTIICTFKLQVEHINS